MLSKTQREQFYLRSKYNILFFEVLEFLLKRIQVKVVLNGGGRFIPLETCKKNKNKQVLTHFYLHDGQSHKKIDWTEVSKTTRATWSTPLFMAVCLGSNIVSVIFSSRHLLWKRPWEKKQPYYSNPTAPWLMLHISHQNAVITLQARADSPSEAAMLFSQLIAWNTRYKPCFISFPLLLKTA